MLAMFRGCNSQCTYTLNGRGEEDVQQEESWRSDPAFDQVPSVVLASDLVSSSAPIVEGKTNRPQHAESHDVVHSLCIQTVHSSPHGIVNVVHGRENRPHTVDLAPVPVDLRNDEEDGDEREGEGKARDDRVRRGVDTFKAIEVAYVGEDLVGQRVELRNPWLDGCAVRSAIGERLDDGHGNPGRRRDEHIGDCCLGASRGGGSDDRT